MKKLTEAQLAWEIWNILAKLNDILWDHYEEEFMEIYLEEEQDKYLNSTYYQDSDTGGKTPP
jgi:hypothetical protein